MASHIRTVRSFARPRPTRSQTDGRDQPPIHSPPRVVSEPPTTIPGYKYPPRLPVPFRDSSSLLTSATSQRGRESDRAPAVILPPISSFLSFRLRFKRPPVSAALKLEHFVVSLFPFFGNFELSHPLSVFHRKDRR